MCRSNETCPAGLTLLFDQATLQSKVRQLAHEILSDHDPAQPLVLIGVLKGAWVFLADLARALAPFPLQIDFVQAASYGMQTESTGNVQLLNDIQMDVGGKSVVLVEDIVDTGYTLRHLAEILATRKAGSVKICSLLDKPSRRKVEVQIDYIGFTIPHHFVVGYGMDAHEDFRHLPFIAYLSENTE